MKKAIFVITVCVLSCVAWVVYSDDDHTGCYNTYQCRAIHSTLYVHDLEVWSDAHIADGSLEVDNDVYAGCFDANDIWIQGSSFYGAFLALKDVVETHDSEDEIRNCSDVEGCFSKSGASAGGAIQCTGQSALSKGMAIIPFDETFAGSVDAAKPIIVLVTPTDAACKGIAVVKTGINEQIEGKTVSGFCVVELNGGESGSTFNWQALGTRK